MKNTTDKISLSAALPELIALLGKVPKNNRGRLIQAATILLEADEEPDKPTVTPPQFPGGGVRYGLPRCR
jgi:hypothetical protein